MANFLRKLADLLVVYAALDQDWIKKGEVDEKSDKNNGGVSAALFI